MGVVRFGIVDASAVVSLVAAGLAVAAALTVPFLTFRLALRQDHDELAIRVGWEVLGMFVAAAGVPGRRHLSSCHGESWQAAAVGPVGVEGGGEG